MTNVNDRYERVALADNNLRDVTDIKKRKPLLVAISFFGYSTDRDFHIISKSQTACSENYREGTGGARQNLFPWVVGSLVVLTAEVWFVIRPKLKRWN